MDQTEFEVSIVWIYMANSSERPSEFSDPARHGQTGVLFKAEDVEGHSDSSAAINQAERAVTRLSLGADVMQELHQIDSNASRSDMFNLLLKIKSSIHASFSDPTIVPH